MFDTHLEFRAKYSVDTVCDNDFLFRPQLSKLTPSGFYGVAKGGYPLQIKAYTSFDISKMLAAASMDQILTLNIATWERLLHIIFPKASELAGRKIDRQISIIDVSGLGMGAMLNSDTRKMTNMGVKIAQENYPETLKKVIVINAPMSFSIIWTFIKTFMNKRTVEKFEILGSKYKKVLLEYVDAD